MSRDWLTLEDGEEVLWAASPRVQSVIPAVFVGLVVAVVPVGLQLTAGDAFPVPVWPLALLGVVPPVLAYVWIRNVEFVVTSRRCYRKQGVLSRDVLAVGFESVQNSSYEQGFFGRLFGHGTVSVDTAGGLGTELAFWNVEDPRSVQNLVLDQRAAFDDGDDELPGTVEQWQAVLAEVRRLRRAAEGYEQSSR
ncbi:PH domain-containing protein [Haloarchaeobius iranensis]|uniref:PH domain-containing protein n=1 Tax=Haloarchaeobius iranensis TaxID=996166 RepID=A0A1G9T5X5_9EURY|nr:PH domain-containing protein [Haloarchaeobius iranensis]SDM43129.1 PH domain-containing protein [Haloarchaeobius iranensis]